MGHLEKSINYRGLETQYTLNELEEVIHSIDPLGFVSTQEYNDAGQVVKSTEGNYELNLELGEIGLIKKQKSSLLEDASFEHDTNYNITKMTIRDYTKLTVYDKENRVIDEIDALGNSTSFKYNILDQVVETTYADGTVTQSEYDVMGRRIKDIDQLGFVSEYSYDTYDDLTEEINL